MRRSSCWNRVDQDHFSAGAPLGAKSVISRDVVVVAAGRSRLAIWARGPAPGIGTAGVWWRGLLVRAIDGTTMAVPDSPANLAKFTNRLVTTLTDHRIHPAAELIELYHQRWEIETAYLEVKSTLLGGRVLRARTPRGINQHGIGTGSGRPAGILPDLHAHRADPAGELKHLRSGIRCHVRHPVRGRQGPARQRSTPLDLRRVEQDSSVAVLRQCEEALPRWSMARYHVPGNSSPPPRAPWSHSSAGGAPVRRTRTVRSPGRGAVHGVGEGLDPALDPGHVEHEPSF
ncbi:transposase [Streptomyces sp. M10(2022)]